MCPVGVVGVSFGVVVSYPQGVVVFEVGYIAFVDGVFERDGCLFARREVDGRRDEPVFVGVAATVLVARNGGAVLVVGSPGLCARSTIRCEFAQCFSEEFLAENCGSGGVGAVRDSLISPSLM